MERLTIQVGGFEVNCSILSENGKAWIVDPGQEAERIIDLLAKKGLEPAAILLTHGHFDHISGIPGLLEKFPELPIYVHEKDVPMFGHPLNQLPPEYPSFAKPKNLIVFRSTFNLQPSTLRSSKPPVTPPAASATTSRRTNFSSAATPFLPDRSGAPTCRAGTWRH